MKVSAKTLKVAMRKRRQEAGEVVRPARRVRRKTQGEPAWASEVPVEAAMAEAAPTEELKESIPDKALVSEGVPAAAEARMEERDQPASTEEVGERSPAAPEPVVVDLDFKSKTPAPMELAEVGKLGADGGCPAPPEPKAEEVALGAGERETTATTNEGEAGPANKGEVELEDSPLPPIQAAT